MRNRIYHKHLAAFSMGLLLLLLTAGGVCRTSAAWSPVAPEAAGLDRGTRPDPGSHHAGTPSGGRASRPLPPDCLVAGRIDDVDALCERMAEILRGLGGESDADALRRQLGMRLNNPTLAGVDRSAPIHFFYMNPKKHSAPWVWQFEVTDADALSRAMAEYWRETESAFLGVVEIDGTQASWCLDERAGDALRRWRAAHPSGVDFRGAGQLLIRADVAGILAAFDDEIAAQTLKMKERMREALQHGERQTEGNPDVSSAQAELETALAVLRQVTDAETAIRMTQDAVRVSLSVTPRADSPLAAFIRAHPPGSPDLLRWCPSDAVVVLAHNLSVARTLRGMVLRILGWAESDEREGEETQPASGHAVFALFLTGVLAGPAEFLELRDADGAVNALERWQRFSAEADATVARPFSLRPLPSEDAGMLQAEIIPNEAVLGAGGARAIQWLFGLRPIAAQEVAARRSIFVVGSAPERRMRRIRALGADGDGESLLTNPQFTRSLAEMPARPNLIVYVSPLGVRKWLGLGGLTFDEPGPGALGLIGGMSFSNQGEISGLLVVPTGMLKPAPQQ